MLAKLTSVNKSDAHTVLPNMKEYIYQATDCIFQSKLTRWHADTTSPFLHNEFTRGVQLKSACLTRKAEHYTGCVKVTRLCF